jgi:methionyl-tRNA synthetase
MLKSAGIPLPRTVFAHGFVKGPDGLKMSKSIGNVVDPVETLKTYSADTFRYFSCRECSWGADLTWSTDSMENRHNSELADTLGNLVHRATNLVNKYDEGLVAACATTEVFDLKELVEDSEDAFAEFRLEDAAEAVADAVRATNKYITDMEPWKMKNDPVGRTVVVRSTLEAVYLLAHFLAPYIPEATGKIFERLGTPATTIQKLSPKFDNLKVGTKITVGDVLFTKFEKEEKK